MGIKLRCIKYETCEEECMHNIFHEEEYNCTLPIECTEWGGYDTKCVPEKSHSFRFQKTKAGLGLCPFLLG